MLEDPRNNVVREIRLFLQEYGIDPFYTVTILAIVLVIFYRKDLKDWDKLEDWDKSIVGSTVLAAIFFSIISLLRLTGLIYL